MRALGEAVVFTGLAAALHLGAIAVWHGDGGARSAGAQGEALLSIEAAPASLSETAERWRRPPEASPAHAAPDAPTADRAPDAPRRDARTPYAAPAAPPTSPAVAPPAPAPPEPRTTAPEPLVRASPATPAQTRPRPRADTRDTATTDSQASAPAPEQTSAGSGGGAQAGRNAQAETATLSAAERNSLMSRWGGRIRAQVERHKRYPDALRARRASGTVTVTLSVARDGRLLDVSVARGSGHAELDAAALRAVRQAGPFPAAPAALNQARMRFSLPVNFKL